MPRQKSTYVEDPVGLAERLKAAREEAGITQRALAFPGCSAAYISRLEAGDRIPSLQLLRELGRRLDVTEEYLLTGSDAPATERIRLVAADVALRLDELDEARQRYEDVVEAPNHESERIEALAGLGAVALREGRSAEAVDQLEAALELAGGEPNGHPRLAESLGRAYLQVGDLASAIALFDRCRAHYAPDVEPLLHVRFSALLGEALNESGDHAGAARVVSTAVDATWALASPLVRAQRYWLQSRRLADAGDTDAAARAAQTAAETLTVTEGTYGLAFARQVLARAYVDAGRPDDAAAVLRDARPLVAATATSAELASFDIEEARVLAARGESDRAAAAAGTAAARLLDAPTTDAARAHLLLADVYERIGDRARAQESLELAIGLLEEQGQTRYLVDAYRQLGLLLEAAGRADEALDVLKRALAIQAGATRVAT